MAQKIHNDFAQAKGSQGGIFLPFRVIKDAVARYYFEDVPSTTPLDIVLQSTTGMIRVSAIGGAIFFRSNNNVSKDAAVKATAVLTLSGAITPSVRASSVLTVTAGGNQIADGDTVTIGALTYTFKTALTPAAYEVLIGANDTAALGNLLMAINASGVAGTDYGTGTEAHPLVVATASDATTLSVASRDDGDANNALATTETAAELSWADTTLGGGTGASTPGVDGETVTVRSVTYKFVTQLTEDVTNLDAVANEVLFGADSAAALDNLKLAVNGDATEGTNYSTGTEQPDDVLATTNTNTAQTFEAQSLGTSGNAYTVSETITNGSFGGSTFSGGSSGANFDAFIQSGETLEVAIDESVQAISVMAVGATTDVAVVEY